jgi:uncharacterized protein with PQ loop repeat
MDTLVDEHNIYGWVGGGLSIVYNLPQIWHVWRTKKVTGVSTISIAMRIISYVLMMVHGYVRQDMPILYTTGVGLMQLIIMYTQVCSYTKKRPTVPHSTDLHEECQTYKNKETIA